LKQNRVSLYLAAGPRGPNAKVQADIAQDSFSFRALFSHHFRDFYFRTAERQKNGGGEAKHKNDRYRDHYDEPSYY
jgi:hypothetical protein